MDSTLEEFKAIVARRLEIDDATLYGGARKLLDVIARSPLVHRSFERI